MRRRFIIPISIMCLLGAGFQGESARELEKRVADVEKTAREARKGDEELALAIEELRKRRTMASGIELQRRVREVKSQSKSLEELVGRALEASIRISPPESRQDLLMRIGDAQTILQKIRPQDLFDPTWLPELEVLAEQRILGQASLKVAIDRAGGRANALVFRVSNPWEEGAFQIQSQRMARILSGHGLNPVQMGIEGLSDLLYVFENYARRGQALDAIVFFGHGGWDGPMFDSDPMQFGPGYGDEEFEEFTRLLRLATRAGGLLVAANCHSSGSNASERALNRSDHDNDKDWTRSVAERTELYTVGVKGQTGMDVRRNGRMLHLMSQTLEYALTGEQRPQEIGVAGPGGRREPSWNGWLKRRDRTGIGNLIDRGRP